MGDGIQPESECDGPRTRAAEESPPGARAGEASGLAPREARAWLELQRRFALIPQQVAARLEAGDAPEAILAAAAHASGAEGARRPAARERAVLDRDLARLERLGVRVVSRQDAAYPARLAALVDAPPVLLVRGDVSALAGPGIALVGARAASRAGLATARRMACELAGAGLTIVSGLARGIDAAAHRGALEGGGRTLAVLACGPERIYPPEHRALAGQIRGQGAILSELPVGSPPRRAHFPLRNRLISGLSLGVVVVEARRRSGSLITVRHALNQGRDVFVVPGSVEGPFAEGSNQLLRDGARPVRDARDLLEDLGVAPHELPASSPGEAGGRSAPRSRGASRKRGATSLEAGTPARRIVSLLEGGPLSGEDLAARLGLEPGPLARALVELELTGRVEEDRDGRLRLCWS